MYKIVVSFKEVEKPLFDEIEQKAKFGLSAWMKEAALMRLESEKESKKSKQDFGFSVPDFD